MFKPLNYFLNMVKRLVFGIEMQEGFLELRIGFFKIIISINSTNEIINTG